MCIHSNCSNKMSQIKEAKENSNSLCEFHQNELDGNSKWICSWCADFKKDKGQCDYCLKWSKEAFEMSDGGYACKNCYMGAVARAENAYDGLREQGLI